MENSAIVVNTEQFDNVLDLAGCLGQDSAADACSGLHLRSTRNVNPLGYGFAVFGPTDTRSCVSLQSLSRISRISNAKMDSGIFLSVHSCFMVNGVVATLIVDIGSCVFTAGFTGEDTICALFPSIVPGFRHHCRYGHVRVGVPAYSAMLGLRCYILRVSLRSSSWTPDREVDSGPLPTTPLSLAVTCSCCSPVKYRIKDFSGR